MKISTKSPLSQQALLLSLVLLSLLTSGLSAAREIRTIFVGSQSDTDINNMYLVSMKNALELKLPKRNLSQEVQLKGKQVSFALLPSPLNEGEEIPAGSPIVNIPAEWKSVILVITPDEKNKVFPYRASPINATVNGMAKGKCYVINISNAHLFFTRGNQKTIVKAKSSKLLDGPISDTGDYPVLLEYISENNKKRKKMFSSTWYYNSNKRELMFVINRAKGLSPRVWSLTYN